MLRLPLVCVLLSGCYLSHDGARPPDGGVDAMAIDVGTRDAPTRNVGRDTPTARDAGGVCATGEPRIEVRVEAITPVPERCAATHLDDIGVYGVEAAIADHGIRIHADFCPLADDDCRCDIVVSNVGADLADQVLIPSSGVSLDVGPSSLFLGQRPTCECLGCPCSFTLVLYAADTLLPLPPDVVRDVTLSPGPELCPSLEACLSPTWQLHVNTSDGQEGDVVAGVDATLGIVHVRSVRDVDIFGPCAACARCGSSQGAWVAWIRH